MNYKVNENMVIRREYFGGVVFNVDAYRNSAYFTVNEEAIDILEMIEFGLPIKKVREIMMIIYGRNSDLGVNEIIRQALANKIIDKADNCKKYKFDFEAFMERRNRISKLERLNSPITVSLNPTLNCNQQCDFCYVNPSWKTQYLNRLSLDDWKALVDQLVKYKIPLIDIVGGEPFAWRYMTDLLEYIQTKPINFIISTNGTLITEEVAKRLGKLNPNRFYLNVSLEDYDEEQHDLVVRKRGAFKAVLKNFTYLKEYKVNFGVNTVVNKRNINRIEPLYKRLRDLGIPQFTVSFFHSEYADLPDSSNEISIIDFYRVWEKIKRLNNDSDRKLLLSKEGPFLWLCPSKIAFLSNKPVSIDISGAKAPPSDPFGLAFCECQLGRSRLDILPDGSVFPCILLTGRKEFMIGRYPQNTIYKLWHNERMQRVYNHIPVKEQPCRSCKFSEACKGGCFSYMLNRHEKTASPDIRCPIVQMYTANPDLKTNKIVSI